MRPYSFLVGVDAAPHLKIVRSALCSGVKESPIFCQGFLEQASMSTFPMPSSSSLFAQALIKALARQTVRSKCGNSASELHLKILSLKTSITRQSHYLGRLRKRIPRPSSLLTNCRLISDKAFCRLNSTKPFHCKFHHVVLCKIVITELYTG